MGARKRIKNNDLFGHSVQLNFNSQGSTHNTEYGGGISLLVKIIMVIYIGILLKKLVFKDDNKNESFITAQDFEELGEVKMNETDVMIIFNIYNSSNIMGPLDKNESEKHIKLMASQAFVDYTNSTFTYTNKKEL